MNIDSKLQLLYIYLQEHNIVTNIINQSYDFHDEPHFFIFHTDLNSEVKKRVKDAGVISDTRGLTASGCSSYSQKLALLKCLMETLERFCLYTYLEENTYIKSYSQLKKKALDPSVFSSNKDVKNNFGWIKGNDIESASEILLPAQLVYINYHLNQKHNEPILSQRISTGAACGFTHEETLLRGIYEVIERDSCMASYLNQVKLARINPVSITSRIIKKAFNTLERYWLTPYIYYIENDFNVPTYLTVLVDNTSNKPEISVGAKASLRMDYGILGSIEEAVFTRQAMKRMVHHSGYQTREYTNSNAINTIDKRGLYWAGDNVKRHVAYLLESKNFINVDECVNIEQSKTIRYELNKVIKQVTHTGYKIYFADIALPQIKKDLKINIYKVLIPGLQPLFLDEQEKEYMVDRLKINSHIYGKKKVKINQIPHPFL